jgi:DNA-binding transcriptional MocR family regulator
MSTVDDDQQFELFQAETTWFHIFRSMFGGGDVAKMGPGAYTVYSAIKYHTNFNTGQAFPSLETIAELSGVSRRKVVDELKVLEDLGYITKARKGPRSSVYTLREKVGIQDTHGRPVAAASWDYLPAGVQRAVADLKNVLVTGDLAGAKIIAIEHLTVNIFNDHAAQNINTVPKRGA